MTRAFGVNLLFFRRRSADRLAQIAVEEGESFLADHAPPLLAGLDLLPHRLLLQSLLLVGVENHIKGIDRRLQQRRPQRLLGVFLFLAVQGFGRPDFGHDLLRLLVLALGAQSGPSSGAR